MDEAKKLKKPLTRLSLFLQRQTSCPSAPGKLSLSSFLRKICCFKSGDIFAQTWGYGVEGLKISQLQGCWRLLNYHWGFPETGWLMIFFFYEENVKKKKQMKKVLNKCTTCLRAFEARISPSAAITLQRNTLKQQNIIKHNAVVWYHHYPSFAYNIAKFQKSNIKPIFRCAIISCFQVESE